MSEPRRCERSRRLCSFLTFLSCTLGGVDFRHISGHTGAREITSVFRWLIGSCFAAAGERRPAPS